MYICIGTMHLYIFPTSVDERRMPMPRTEKQYPEWVQKFRKKGTTIKKRGDIYYLYNRTSRRVPGKKYPQPVDTYVGIITPDGVVRSDKKKVSLTDAVVKEFGFSRAMETLCPQGWKEPLGDGWRDVLDYIIEKESEESYIPMERPAVTELDAHISYGAQKSSLYRRIYKEKHIDVKELMILSKIYIIYIDGNRLLSKLTDEQKKLIEDLHLDMEVG